jgi:hypothetical protein
VPLPFEFAAQLPVVVQLAVIRDDEAPVLREHRLVARLARVNDGQTPVAEARAPPVLVHEVRSPHALVVAPPVLDGPEHRADAPLRLLTD